MLEAWKELSHAQPLLSGALLGAAIFCAALILMRSTAPAAEETVEASADPPRDFTPHQIAGQVYVAIKGDVFDVSTGPYGPGQAYEVFAGHDASKCLATMSTDEADLDASIDDLNHGEREALDDWYTKFKYVKNYPCLGRLSVPPAGLAFTADTLRASVDGVVPPGRIHAPLLVAVDGKVYDVSYGGVDHYGPGGPYAKFVGRDASRALATMSLDDDALANPSIDDLDDKKRAVLDDWIKLFERKYPHVGDLLK